MDLLEHAALTHGEGLATLCDGRSHSWKGLARIVQCVWTPYFTNSLRLSAPTTRRRPRRRRVSAIGPLLCPLCALSGVPPWHPPLRTGTPRVTFGLVISLEIADWLPKRGKTKGTVLLLRLLVRYRSAARRRLVGSSCGVPPFRSHLVSSLYPPAPGRNHEAMIPIQAVMCQHPRSLNPLPPAGHPARSPLPAPASPADMISLIAFGTAQPADCAGDVCSDSFDGDAFIEGACEVLAARVPIDGLMDRADVRSCGQWSAAGECDRNPGFMHEQCQLSCLRRVCMASDYAMPAEYGVPGINQETGGLALAAAIHANLGSSWLQSSRASRSLVSTERCVAQNGNGLDDEALRLLVQTWQTGIPGDNGCALTAESAAFEVRALESADPSPISPELTRRNRAHRWSTTGRSR